MTLETEFVPADDAQSRWLMVVLHGLGDSLEGYRWLPSAMRLPWLNYLLVNAPDEYYGGYSWFDFDRDPLPGIQRSRDLLFDLLGQQAKNGLPTEQTFMFGFSQGCLMTLEMGMRYPQKFAGLIGVSGYVVEPEKTISQFSPVARQQRFLVTHGTFDPLLSIAEVIPQIKTLKAAGLNIDWREFAKEHTIAGEAELDVIRQFILATDRIPSRALQR